MPPTIPTTFVDGTPIVATALDANLRAVASWLNGGSSAADLATSRWVERRHIVRPTYDGITGTFHFVSCLLAGQAYGPVPTFNTNRYTYASTRSRSTAASTPLPGTGLGFRMPRGGVAIYNLTAYPVGFYDMTNPGGYTDAQVSIDRLGASPVLLDGILLRGQEDVNSGFPGIRKVLRHPWACTAVRNLSAGDHSVEMVVQTSATKTVLLAWTISLEVRWT